MRYSFIIQVFIVALVSFTIPADQKMTSGWVIEKNSSMSIEGSSNINAFTCDITEYLNQDTLLYSRDDKSKKLMFLNSVLNIEINRFDCHQKYITADFRKILQSDKTPCLKVKFISLDELAIGGIVKGVVEIEIAGQKKRMEINYSVQQYGNSQLQLLGSKLMQFSDFNLTPPRKLLGLIHINEDIKVNFHLHFRRIT
jgi:hypothetical protein